MKIKRNRYRTGSICKVAHSNGGFSWEFRYYSIAPDGTRKSTSQTFSGHLYPTQLSVRNEVQGVVDAMNSNSLAVKAAATLNTIINRYIEDELPSLKPSTQETDLGTVENHVRPRWGSTRL